ncbi:MAG: peptide chain release factor N(5)-glutamine methyltransferase [Flavobacteriales bacterium]|jgi:release factor glutamine methyltransferase
MLKVGNIIPLFLKKINNYSNEETTSIAYIVIQEILGFNKIHVILNSDNIISLNHENKINLIINNLKLDKPIQYILGKANFFNLSFFVNKYVLIPRPETEELINWILENKFNKVLEIGTGSGCISISLAKNSSANISAIDISSNAIKIARKNADNYKLDINFLCEDVFTFKTDEKYDLIVSNPPYVLESEKKKMHNNVLNFEPHNAIFVKDTDPLLFYNFISVFASQHLNSNGFLFFEINEMFENEIILILKRNNFVNIELKKDLNGKDRMIKANKK